MMLGTHKRRVKLCTNAARRILVPIRAQRDVQCPHSHYSVFLPVLMCCSRPGTEKANSAMMSGPKLADSTTLCPVLRGRMMLCNLLSSHSKVCTTMPGTETAHCTVRCVVLSKHTALHDIQFCYVSSPVLLCDVQFCYLRPPVLLRDLRC
eukprot:236099-Rhodomonas_salina.1